MRALVLLLISCVACGETIHEKHVVSAPRPLDVVATPAPIDLGALANAVDAIDAAPRQEAPVRIRVALDLVASAVARHDASSGREVAKLSQRLVSSRSGRVVLVRRALDIALDGLVANLQAERSDEVRRAYMMARRGAKLVSEGEPLHRQIVEVEATFR
jgi:hypothetical protein